MDSPPPPHRVCIVRDSPKNREKLHILQIELFANFYLKLTPTATSITSEAAETTLYVFENSSNHSVNQIGAKHYLYEIDGFSNKRP